MQPGRWNVERRRWKRAGSFGKHATCAFYDGILYYVRVRQKCGVDGQVGQMGMTPLQWNHCSHVWKSLPARGLWGNEAKGSPIHTGPWNRLSSAHKQRPHFVVNLLSPCISRPRQTTTHVISHFNVRMHLGSFTIASHSHDVSASHYSRNIFIS